ncbi:MAG: hypothetical protein ACLGSH_07295 [Acidobacteriota bacterium]
MLEMLWPQPGSGPAPAHYLLLAAIHRICPPGPRTEVADGDRSTVLAGWWDIAPERFRPQAFGDAFESILPESLPAAALDPLDPPQGEKGPPRVAYVLSQQSLVQQALLKTLDRESLHRSTPGG